MTIVRASFVDGVRVPLGSGTITYTPTRPLPSTEDASKTVMPVHAQASVAAGVVQEKDLNPGPYDARIEIDGPAWFTDTFKIIVPETGPVNLMDLVEETTEYQPPVVGAVAALRDEVNAAVATVEGLATAQDAAVADLVAPGTATKAALDGTYAPGSVVTSVAAIAPDLGARAVGKSELVYNVLDWGAYGQGTSKNDTVGIQAAINAAAAAGGGIVYLPKRDYSVTQVRMKSKVTLAGAGWGTRIVQRTGTNAHLVVLDTVSTEFTVIRDLTLHGNKDNQTTVNDCINYDNTAGSFSFYDPNHIIQRVLCYIPSGVGVYLSANCRETKMSDVFVTGAGTYGFQTICTDSVFVNCTTGAAARTGWVVSGPNSRFVNCKAFGSGSAALSGDAAGFRLTSRRISMTGCEAQDNAQHGFQVATISGSLISLTGCLADSNGTSMSGSGFRFTDTTKFSLTGCLSFDRNASGSRHQRYGLELSGSISNASVDMVTMDNTLSGYVAPTTLATSTIMIDGVLV